MTTRFKDFQLHPDLLKAVSEMGFEKPTPIQAKSIPKAVEGADILGSAQTGSGKTVAFSLPLLHRLMLVSPQKGQREVRAVILAPVRELAAQVEAVLNDCGRHTGLRVALIIGGASWHNQVKALKAGADIVVATPGRLLDHMRNNRQFRLDSVRFLVLDEADRMLDMGFLPEVQQILKAIPTTRQTLMFSATIPAPIERLVRGFMKDPVRVQIDPPHKPAEGIRQAVYPVSEAQKYDLLFTLLEDMSVKSALVFTGTKRRADIVEGYLRRKKISAAAIHSDLSQSARTKTLDQFRDQKVRILVATDIAARGLDIRHVSHVFNYDVPSYAEDYLHRIGRTARVFTVGDAITLMAPSDKSAIESIERFLKKDIPRKALEGFPYDVPPKLTSFKRPLNSRFGFKRRSFRRGSSRLF